MFLYIIMSNPLLDSGQIDDDENGGERIALTKLIILSMPLVSCGIIGYRYFKKKTTKAKK